MLCLRKHQEIDSDVLVKREMQVVHTAWLSFQPQSREGLRRHMCSHISRPAAEQQSPGVGLKVGEHNKINQSLTVTERVAEWGGGGEIWAPGHRQRASFHLGRHREGGRDPLWLAENDGCEHRVEEQRLRSDRAALSLPPPRLTPVDIQF